MQVLISCAEDKRLLGMWAWPPRLFHGLCLFWSRIVTQFYQAASSQRIHEAQYCTKLLQWALPNVKTDIVGLVEFTGLGSTKVSRIISYTTRTQCRNVSIRCRDALILTQIISYTLCGHRCLCRSEWNLSQFASLFPDILGSAAAYWICREALPPFINSNRGHPCKVVGMFSNTSNPPEKSLFSSVEWFTAVIPLCSCQTWYSVRVENANQKKGKRRFLRNSMISHDPQLPSLRRFASELMISGSFLSLGIAWHWVKLLHRSCASTVGIYAKAVWRPGQLSLASKVGYQCCQILDVKCEKLWRELTTQATQSL